MKTLSILVIVFFCLFFFWIPIAIGATVFGLLAGLFGAITGILGAVFGLIAGLIGGIFKLLSFVFTAPFNWSISTPTLFILIAIILLIAVASSNSKASKQ